MRPNLSKTDLGEATRQMICARLMLAGSKVFRPLTEDTPIDLLILRGVEVLRCQCKYIYAEKNGSHTINLYSVRKNGPGSKAIKHLYTKSEVDFFLGYCVDDDSVYVVPFEEVRGRSEMTFWISREKKGRNQFDNTENNNRWKNAFHLLYSSS